jgi:hypothetical protein
VAIPDDDVAVHFAAGKAEMRVDNLPVRDYHNAANSLGKDTFATAFDPAVVSFDVVWSGPITRHVQVPDGTLGNHYAGEYVENQVTVTWSGKNLAEGFTFTANPGTFVTSSVDGGFAELGRERNGILARSDENDPGDSGQQGDDQERNAAVARDALAATPAGSGQPIQPAQALDRRAAGAALPPVPDQGKDQLLQLAAAPAWLSVGAAHRRALDWVFADLEGSTRDALGADGGPAWVV